MEVWPLSRKKRFGMLIALLCLVVSAGYGDDADWWGSYYSPGNLALSTGVGIGGGISDGSGLSLTAKVGGEVPFLSLGIADSLPLDLGAVISVRYAMDIQTTPEHYLGVGAGLSVHVGFRGFDALDLPFAAALAPLDLFVNLGLAYDVVEPESSDLGLGVMISSGVRYFLNERLSLGIHSDTWRGSSDISFSVAWRFGKTRELGSLRRTGPVQQISSLELRPYLVQIHTMYREIFTFDGMAFDDTGYEPGAGVIWRISIEDEAGQVKTNYLLERSLLENLADGSRWWRLALETPGDGFRRIFEYRVDRQDRILEIRIGGSADQRVQVHLPAAPAEWWGGSPSRKIDPATLDSEFLIWPNGDSSERVEIGLDRRVPGGLSRFVKHGPKETARGEVVETREDMQKQLSGK